MRCPEPMILKISQHIDSCEVYCPIVELIDLLDSFEVLSVSLICPGIGHINKET
jgi:hypothetical protein